MTSIILVGPRSVGKTTVGKELAKLMKLNFYDLDEIVDKKINIQKHVKKEKYDLIRIKENKILRDFLKSSKKDFILSVGGGTIASQLKEISQKNLELLRKKSKIIYLIPSRLKFKNIRILHKRENSRKGDQNLAEIKKLYKLRTPIYKKSADKTILCQNKSPLEIAKKIMKVLK